MKHIVALSDEEARLHAVAGGKGTSLARLVEAGFPVPPGFVVTTAAYTEFIAGTRIDARVAEILAAVDRDDYGALDSAAAEIRDLIAGAEPPSAIADGIAAAYGALGSESRVAVRSSGTAEDLEGASFAGLHETFLHVRGTGAVLSAITRCWASLWTTRATVYRANKGFDSAAVSIAVVVQAMIEAEVSGVMFTANPVNTATDEILINSSWGLGEAIVSGITTPDQYTVKRRRAPAQGFDQRRVPMRSATTLEVKARTIGAKERRTVRDPDAGQGVVTQVVTDEQRSVLTLTDTQALELAELGLGVQSFYEDMPQDIEWAFRDGRFHLLQSRPITGVPFDWAADMESFQWAPENANDLWTRAYAELVTGAKSPLYYQWVASCDSAGFYALGNLLDIPELAGPSFTHGGGDVYRSARLQVHKYHRGELYHSTEVEKVVCERLMLPSLRPPEVSRWITPEQAADVRDTPFRYRDFLASLAKVNLLERGSAVWSVLDEVRAFIESAREPSDYTRLPDMSALSDDALKDAIDEQFYVTTEFGSRTMILWMVYASQVMGLFARIVQSWYTGENTSAYAELCQGVSTRSKTLQENFRLYDLAERIRQSPTLSQLFAEHRGADFFHAAQRSADGQPFLEAYRQFLSEHGHRGHEDRCFSYPRRWEDPSIDYRSFQLILSHEHERSPLEKEEELNARRTAAYDDVLENLRRSPISGPLKAAAFVALYNWVQKFLAIRDDERWAYEMSVFCAKLYCRELGRRCQERGLLEDREDFVMFTKDELFDMLDGHANPRIARAKAAQRRHDHNLALERKRDFPAYLRDGREVAVDSAEADGELVGTGWTSGTSTATARVVDRLTEINRVRPGEILVCQSTDPGWTPVFMLLSGIVIESGGVLSHAVCLSREYGLPAVQLPGARKLIPDGAIVTLNGSTGEITILDGAAASEQAGDSGDGRDARRAGELSEAGTVR